MTEAAAGAKLASSGAPLSRRRIAFVGVSPQARGGIAQFGANLVRQVADDTHVCVLGYRRLYPRFTRPGRQAPDPSALRADVPATSGLVPWLPWTWLAARRELRRFHPTLLVLQWWSPLFGPCIWYLARDARRAGARVAIVCHNYRPHERFPFWRALTRIALREADVLLTLSTPVAEGLGELLPGSRILAGGHPPNLPELATGDDPDRWRARLQPLEGRVILFFGNVRAYKGLEDLIDAMPHVRERLEATLVVAGTFFKQLRQFESQAASLGVSRWVRFFPHYVHNEDVPGLFALADVVALPYRSGSQSGVVAQAALTQTPVVATAVGGLPEAVGDRGLLVPPRDPVRLADGLVRALEDPPPPPMLDEDPWRGWREVLLAESAASIATGS
jgi:glycosyltransferase involved in cell wall biosynthesis